MNVFVVCRLHETKEGFEVNGVFSTVEKALAVCKGRDCVAEMPLDEDVSEVNTFNIYTLDNPQGVMA